jgi:NADPH:quinone reductase-like Zn-dependent oxidoreductase
MDTRRTSSEDLVLVRLESVRPLQLAGSRVAFAGVVEAVAARITLFQYGDAVFGVADGSFGGYVCVRPEQIVPKPDALTFEAAAERAAHQAVAAYTP